MVDRNHEHVHEHEHDEHDHDLEHGDHEGHEHEHDHGEHDEQDEHEHVGHDHSSHDHEHDHDEHGHDHGDHDHDHDHDHDEVAKELANGQVVVNLHEEGALITSGTLSLSGVDVDDISSRLAHALNNVARNIEEAGGLIGHLKASITESTVRMLSTTAVETEVSVLLSPQSGLVINVILIAFMVEESDMLKWGQDVMDSLQ